MSHPRKYFLGANWKCNGTTSFVKDYVGNLINDLKWDKSKLDLMLFPGLLHMSLVKAQVQEGVQVGAQNVSAMEPGAYTGEVSADHIKDYGIEYVLIGHSERRQLFGETQEQVSEKVRCAQDCELGIVYCVGETAHEKDEELTEQVLHSQLAALQEHVKDWSNIIIVYQPLWAIGTGTIASADQTQEACQDIRQWIKETINPEVAEATRIVYGGSVTETNGENLIKLPDLDGFLVGSTSCKPIFRTIFEIVERQSCH